MGYIENNALESLGLGLTHSIFIFQMHIHFLCNKLKCINYILSYFDLILGITVTTDIGMNDSMSRQCTTIGSLS